MKAGLTSLFVLVLSASCADNKRVVTRTEVVEKKVPVYKPVPEELTKGVELPGWPDRKLVNKDLSDWIKAAEAAVKKANKAFEEIRKRYGGESDAGLE